MAERDGVGSGLACTAERFAFDPNLEVWRLGSGSGSATFDFFRLVGASSTLRSRIKSALLKSVAVRRTSAARRDFEEIVGLLRDASGAAGGCIEEIGLSDVEGFASRLPPGSLYRASFLKDALVHWALAGGNGLTGELIGALPDMAYPRCETGRPVRTCCPLTGALSAGQRDGLLIALWKAYDADRTSLADHCMAWLITLLGFRPCQMARLKVCDLTSAPGLDGQVCAMLMVPRAKQRNRPPRGGGFSELQLVPELADPLWDQREIVMEWAFSKGIDPANAPMFPVFTRPGKPLPPRIPGMAGHMEARDVSRHVSRLIERLNAVPGLVAGSRVTPARLRRTRGSVLADEGVPLADIAAALDQSGVGTVLSYLQQTAALAARLERGLGPEYAELARGFRRSAKYMKR